MHPPVDMCKRLYRIHPQLRLAWAGKPSIDDKLNNGSFAVVQLYHIRDVGKADETHTFRQLWDYETVTDSLGRPTLKRVDRGPIFSKDGSTKRDWNSLVRVPVFVCTIDEAYTDPVTGEPLKFEDVWTGRFLVAIRRWLMPIKDRIREAQALHAKETIEKANAVSDEMTDFLLWEANKADQRSDASMARKFYRHGYEEIEKKNEKLDKEFQRMFSA